MIRVSILFLIIFNVNYSLAETANHGVISSKGELRKVFGDLSSEARRGSASAYHLEVLRRRLLEREQKMASKRDTWSQSAIYENFEPEKELIHRLELKVKNTKESLRKGLDDALFHYEMFPYLISKEKSLVEDYNKFEYQHQLIFLDTRDKSVKNKEVITRKIRRFGENIGDKGLLLTLKSSIGESRLALARTLKQWNLDASKYSSTGGPYLIGHVGITKINAEAKGRLHITDFSGMSTECISDYIDDIEWSILIGNVESGEASEVWTIRNFICEGSKIAEEGYSKSIKEAYQYFRTWF